MVLSENVCRGVSEHVLTCTCQTVVTCCMPAVAVTQWNRTVRVSACNSGTMRRSMRGSREMGRCQLVYCQFLAAGQSVQPNPDSPGLNVHRSGLGREAHCGDYFSQSNVL